MNNVLSYNVCWAKYRTISFFLIIQPLFPCFLHHYCLQILYTTNFLIENVFIYLYHFKLMLLAVVLTLISCDTQKIHKMHAESKNVTGRFHIMFGCRRFFIFYSLYDKHYTQVGVLYTKCIYIAVAKCGIASSI